MSDWFVVACLQRLRDEINALAPNRAKGADGTVGDVAHQEHTSDHNPDETGAVPIHDADHLNEVHALDITTELNESGLSLEMIVQLILARCRSGAERRLRYIIFNRRIFEAGNGWRQEVYTGTADPHTGHAHFSASYESALEASTASWHLEDIPVALTAADKAAINDMVADRLVAAIPRIVDAVTDAVTKSLPPATFTYARQQKAAPMSDTARNLLGAEITEAVLAGKPIDRFPANVVKK